MITEHIVTIAALRVNIVNTRSTEDDIRYLAGVISKRTIILSMVDRGFTLTGAAGCDSCIELKGLHSKIGFLVFTFHLPLLLSLTSA